MIIYSLNDSLEAPKRGSMVLVIFVLLGLWGLAKRGAFNFKLTLLDLAVVGLVFSYFISSIFSIDFLTSLFGVSGGKNGNNNTLLFVLVCGLFYGLTKYAYQEKIIIFSQVIWAILGGGAVAFLYYFYSVGALPGLFLKPLLVLFQNPPTALPSTQTHQIILAFYLLGIFWLSLLYGLINLQKFMGKISLLLSVVFIWLILLTQVRGAVLLLVVETAVLGLLFGKAFLSKLNLAAKVAGVLIFLLALIMFQSQDSLWLRFRSLAQPHSDKSVSLRWAEWEGAFKVFLKKPFWGYGPNTIQFTYPEYKPIFVNQNEIEWQIHTFDIRNHYLNSLASVGLSGLISLLTIIILTVTMVMKKKDLEIIAIFGLWVSLVLSLLLYHQTVALAILFWGSLGILSAQCKEKVYFKFSLGSRTVILILIISFLAITGAGMVFASNIYYSRAISMADVSLSNYSLQNTEETNNLFIKTESLNPLNFKAYYDHGRFFLEIMKQFTVSKQSYSYRNDIFNSGQISFENALKLSPNSLEAKRALSLLYLYETQLEPSSKPLLKKSLSLAGEVVAVDPYQPQNWDVLGQILLADGQLGKAEESFRKAISLKDNYLIFYYHLGEALKQEGQFDEAIKAYKEVFKFAPSDQFAVTEIKKTQEIQNRFIK